MPVTRNRLYYLAMIIAVIALGLLSRKVLFWLPEFIGDVLWGLMVFFIMGFIFRQRPTLYIAALAAAFSIGIETAKLWHAPWLEYLRYTTIGGLILGYVFSLANIVYYISGIFAGAIGEIFMLKRRR